MAATFLVLNIYETLNGILHILSKTDFYGWFGQTTEEHSTHY